MSKIKIEDYRGYEIFFDNISEVFTCSIVDMSEKESKSFSAIKMHIDEFIKQNINFKEFDIVRHPKYTICTHYTVIGISKDFKVTVKDQNGNVGILPKFDISDYVLLIDKNDELQEEINVLRELDRQQQESINSQINNLISKMEIVELGFFLDQINNRLH